MSRLISKKIFRNNCITSALKMLSKCGVISFHLPSYSVHIVYQPLKDDNKTNKNPQKIKTCMYFKNNVNYFFFPPSHQFSFPFLPFFMTLSVSDSSFKDSCQVTGLQPASNGPEKEDQMDIATSLHSNSIHKPKNRAPSISHFAQMYLKV